MEIGAVGLGGGFSQLHGAGDVAYLVLCSFVPPLTLVLATYHVVALGLMLSAGTLLLLHFRFEKSYLTTGNS